VPPNPGWWCFDNGNLVCNLESDKEGCEIKRGLCCDWQDDCDDTVGREVNRRVGITLRHPYLTNIWNQTTNPETQGLFNIFRPQTATTFTDLDAHAQEKITYDYNSGSTTPTEGKFYFSHLAGIQIAKDWTVKALLPYGFEGELLPEPTSTPTPAPAPGPYRIVGRVRIGEEVQDYSNYAGKIASNDDKTCTKLDDTGYQIGRWAVGSKVTISMDTSGWADDYECNWTFTYDVDQSSGTGPTIAGSGCSAEVTISTGEGTNWSEDWANHFWFHLY
jgi:hypothetical protein